MDDGCTERQLGGHLLVNDVSDGHPRRYLPESLTASCTSLSTLIMATQATRTFRNGLTGAVKAGSSSRAPVAGSSELKDSLNEN